MPKSLDSRKLVQLLAGPRPVTVLDIRDPEDHEAWSIPGSVLVPAVDALYDGHPEALDAFDAPRDRPVVAVCGRGRSSVLAAAALEARGFDAFSLEGGMRAWSLAWDAVDVGFAGPGRAQGQAQGDGRGEGQEGPGQGPGQGTVVVQVRRLGKGCLSYLVASNGEALVVDASLDPEVYEELCRARDWRISGVVDTHIHADHLSRGPDLARRAGAPYMLPRTGRSRVERRELDDGSTVAVGAERLDVLAVPGHTPESVALLLPGRAVLTGDTLFARGVGRPDLEATSGEARARAVALHGSLRRLAALGDELVVLAAHADGALVPGEPAVAAPMREATSHARGIEDHAEAFATALLAKLPPPPPNHAVVVKMNEAGDWPKDPVDLEAGGNRCAVPG
ncbi:MAG TPA: MBL fold metallo-hydrolase [Candidatus Thermoplasmatota archaeon]|nr:MBL fold metallo-hydrolase [Candidatus Thermoplasmatota archaeon]